MYKYKYIYTTSKYIYTLSRIASARARKLLISLPKDVLYCQFHLEYAQESKWMRVRNCEKKYKCRLHQLHE